ncbi:MAG: excinuclease ABC subunit B [Puniceicoccaceae bacterium]|nr:excinuclease ABC subunit B [Puniceicoccaceae bacterium]|tara:strand:+ start:1349 stop:1852 length:504 start_codon:yes stop_codon:yes gene_type:complete
MSNKLKCSLCNQDATVHLTQIINNSIQKIDLCESCAQKKGVTDAEGFSLAEMLASSQSANTLSKEVCIDCGLNLPEFKKLGRFGCPKCYESFVSVLKSILEDMHAGSTHIGKLPKKSLARVQLSEQISNLSAKMEAAIKEEAYEDAAAYRDQIDALNKSQEKSDIPD